MIEDRAEIVKIITKMLDNPDECGIYPTTRAYNELESYISNVRMQCHTSYQEAAKGRECPEEEQKVRFIGRAGTKVPVNPRSVGKIIKKYYRQAGALHDHNRTTMADAIIAEIKGGGNGA